MSIILKPLFEIFTGDITICGNILYNYAFLWVVGELAYYVAYGSVGKLYSSGAITGCSAGSAVHWFIRFLFYIIAAYVLRALMWLYSFVTSVPVQIWWALFTFLIICLTLVIVFKAIKWMQPQHPSVKN